MNAFIELRKSFFESPIPVSFPEYYLENPGFNHGCDSVTIDSLVGKIARIRTLYAKKAVSEIQIMELLSELGENDYLDRYSVDLIIRHPAIFSEDQLRHRLQSMLIDQKTTPTTFCHLLDICIECELPLLEENQLLKALHHYENNPTTLSLLLDYMNHFQQHACTDYLYALFDQDYSPNLKMQILEGLVSLYTWKDHDSCFIRQIIHKEENPQLYGDYLNLLNKNTTFSPKGITVMQTMFYGDPEFGGKGQSGGLGTLLKTLGNQLAKQSDLARVITLTINNDWSHNQTLVTHYSDKHWLIRLPAYLDPEDKHAFLRRELFIKRFVEKFVNQLDLKPDIFHIRYLDNASKAMAMLSRETGAKLVLTLTPDPHRTMVDEKGLLKQFTPEETLEKLNKITIGDELLTMAHGVLGIGGMAVKKELKLYFPKLRPEIRQFAFQMVAEGINTDAKPLDFDVDLLLTDSTLHHHIHREFNHKPIILNVGRLALQKGQDQLLKAWGESRLWQDYNLVIIGGSFDHANEEETRMIQLFNRYMASRPDLKGRFAHIEALSNGMIRNIERKIMEHPPGDLPQIYLCSSPKEEFGLAMLEALKEKLLIFGPVQGGVKTYISNGKNGFLIDTTSWETISGEVEKILYDSNRNREDFEKIQRRGQQTVLKNFSMDQIAKRFLSFYLKLSQEP
ncbi:glycosyltransferase family 4 protein [Acetobacterium bakii]|uniref:Glycosyl transferase family 1 domain-containing protein n=1 Tax=Acetobacterium bakii TaxID=52689 RepID=A0A0L6U152_9FIRM|nr:glycosyltransferase family 4 protein [Acetobacterium bakii]KNZ42072.1 hypothetical protein AKG39_08555 [Acetobacterium bakii]